MGRHMYINQFSNFQHLPIKNMKLQCFFVDFVVWLGGQRLSLSNIMEKIASLRHLQREPLNCLLRVVYSWDFKENNS